MTDPFGLGVAVAGGTLPATGANDVEELLIVSLLMIGVGLLLLRRRRFIYIALAR
ncbi:MAG: LPXTG cell wall anchor domain-containing protein [Acidimicrobiia bacterium]